MGRMEDVGWFMSGYLCWVAIAVYDREPNVETDGRLLHWQLTLARRHLGTTCSQFLRAGLIN